ncbi:hypothetical protein KOR42_45810 [Thalassoglobus neptunius]|uniref:Lipoprotein n=1 Tax=Thalassoglobus neptunius TaxID=1938619 RepID=A0A5C5VZ12_9PLAN|nr:hypothetical protein [Thalassoglobus neptunius]TWT42981.1 hypothetical protein KOR42_45810 [Thalassoglobus neptunius]
MSQTLPRLGCWILLLVALAGCQDFDEAFDTKMASRRELPELDRTAQREAEEQARSIAMSRGKQASTASDSHKEPEPVVEQPVEPVPIEKPVVEPTVKDPLFGGVTRHLVFPVRVGRRAGVRFDLSVSLLGEEVDLSQFDYQVEIRDSSGASKTFPLQLRTNRVLLDEFIPGAGVQETFEFQVRYTPTGEDEWVPLRDNWGIFTVSD